jgi:hypothetical protein
VHKRIASAVRRAESVSLIILRRRWSHIILNVHVLVEDKIDDEFGSVFNKFEYFSGDFSADSVPVLSLSEFLAVNTALPGSIPGATRFYEWRGAQNGLHPAS